MSERTESLDLELLSKDLRGLENKLMPQLDELGSKLPEIYSGYANLVRTVTSQLLEICKVSEKNSDKIALAAEISARAIESFGSYRAAKKHNQMLNKFLTVKQGIAKLNSNKIKRLLPESSHNLAALKRLFDAQMSKTCVFSQLSQNNVGRVANIQLRVLNMYRTSLFLNKLARYLDKEYTAWNKGSQTSGEKMPDYYDTNLSIAIDLWGNNEKVFKAVENAADATVSLTGKDIILLCDQQLFTYAIGDEICDISLEKAHPYVKEMLSLHKGVENHLSSSKSLREHIDDVPSALSWFICFLSWIAIICMAIWYLPGTTLTKILISATGCIAIYKIGMTSTKKIKKIYFPKGDTLIEEYIKNICRQCGKADVADIDYEEKDALSLALKTFIK